MSNARTKKENIVDEMDLFKMIKINRKLKSLESKRFSDAFPNWRGSGTMIISGSQVHFNDIFVNFDKVPVIKKTLGKNTKKILSTLEVGIYNGMGYLWIDNHEGRLKLMASKKYILKGRRLYIYLDVVHELVHIKQNAKGIDLWNDEYEYLEKPTEIEAYTVAAKEGKRLGMSERELKSYLSSPWNSREDNKNFYSKISKALKRSKH
jgi:hypothetical protein